MLGELLGHYRIDSKLGEGGMGVVYKAWDGHLDRFVAIKVLASTATTNDLERRRRFMLEAKAASALNHPNIITIHDIHADSDPCYIVMEMVEGDSLKQFTTMAGGAPLETTLRVARQIAGALSVAHARGVVHRDLKPANILFTRDERIKILDFGVAKLLEEPAESSSLATRTELTGVGMVVGTASYMSPEQINAQPIDGRSDVFAAGVLLYELLVGQRPFRGETTAAAMASILYKEPTPPRALRPEIPEELEAIVLACLRKEPAGRPSALELERAVMQQLGDSASRTSFTMSGVTRSPLIDRQVPSVAVLPFANLSGDKENDYFGDGLAEEIINALTRVPNLRVTARASAFAFRGTQHEVAAIGERLRVQHLLEGGVRMAKGRLRVTVNLINVADGFQVWSERFDREMTDVFEVQDEIAGAIVAKLRVQLAGEDAPPTAPAVVPAAAAKRVHEPNVEAYKHYLKGRFHWNRRAWAELRKGIESFEQALAIDAAYADALAGLADSYNLLGYYNERAPRLAYERAKAAEQEALRLDAGHAGAYASIGYTTLFYDWDWKAADQAFRCAVELDGQNSRAHHWHAWYYFVTGDRAAGLACMRRAHDRDPLAPIVNDHLGLALSLAGEHDRALEQLRRTLEIDPNFFLAHYRMGWVHLHLGDPAAAVTALEQAAALSQSKYGVGLLGYALGRAGREDDARACFDRMRAAAAERFHSPLEDALVWAGLGDWDRTFSSLNQAIDVRISDLVLFLAYPWPDPMRMDPRFHVTAARIGLI